MITTNDQKLARRARLLRDHGQSRKYHHVILGYNYHMTEMCAAVGLVQLTKLDGFNKRRRANAELLTRGVNEIPGLTPPYVKDGVKHVFSQYVIRVEDNYPMNRNELIAHLTKNGVGVDVHYPIPIYRQPLYGELGYARTVCPMTEETCKRVLSIPVHPSVTKGDIEYMLSILKDATRSDKRAQGPRNNLAGIQKPDTSRLKIKRSLTQNKSTYTCMYVARLRSKGEKADQLSTG